MVDYLLDNGAQVNIGSSGNCPLSAAIWGGHWILAEILLDRGANPDGVPLSNLGLHPNLPIISAIYRDNIGMVSKLLKQGANLNTPHDRCEEFHQELDESWRDIRRNECNLPCSHPLCYALKLGRNKIIDLLVASGAETTISNFCPFMTALSVNNVQRFRKLMETQTDLMTGLTVEKMLCRGTRNESLLAVQDLIDEKFPDCTIKDPVLLLQHAIHVESPARLSWLLKHGVSPSIDIKPQTSYSNAPRFALLPQAIAVGHYDHAGLLLENAVDVNLNDSKLGTAIYVACKQNNKEWMSRLISLGARMEQPNWYRDECWKLAHLVASNGDTDMTDFVLENGVSIMAYCALCGSALSCAVRSENVDMIGYLVEKGCDINELNVSGMPLLTWAEDDLLDDASSELRRHGASKIVNQRQKELHVEHLVPLLCQELSSIDDSQSGWWSDPRWLALGRCLLIGNDPDNALIALEQTLWPYKSANERNRRWWPYVAIPRCRLHYSERYHICQNSTSLAICESQCLKPHEEQLRQDGKLENHAHLMFPRPFFPGEIMDDHVFLDKDHQIPLETWLESLKDWKFKSPKQ